MTTCTARLGPRSCTRAPHIFGPHEDPEGTWLGHTPLVMTLTDFLLARIADDEAAARNASRVRETRTGDSWAVARGRYALDKLTRADRPFGEVEVSTAPHIARHDPARVLAECDAKRRIVEEYAKAAEEAANTLTVDDQFDSGTEFGLGVALRLLALPYAGHPDYRQEWAP